MFFDKDNKIASSAIVLYVIFLVAWDKKSLNYSVISFIIVWNVNWQLIADMKILEARRLSCCNILIIRKTTVSHANLTVILIEHKNNFYHNDFTKLEAI